MKKNKKPLLTAVVANHKGEIFEVDGYAAVGMSGFTLEPLSVRENIVLPHGSELLYLPERKPVLYNLRTEQMEILDKNPLNPREKILPVATFSSPGYVLSNHAAYEEAPRSRILPLFSYGAVGWYQGGFRSAAIRVDWEKRQDLRLMDPQKIAAGVKQLKKKMPQNRLRRHLENCALSYSCPAAKNFFLGRYEAPLPTSRHCNARCLGCISLQKRSEISHCQERIDFTPSVNEIVEIALTHIRRVKHSIVSFGQGCEGDPLLSAAVIEPAVRKIRAATDKGTINMNTNGSRPDLLQKLFVSGLDSIRISLNSVREACYNTYFRPQGYSFSDVVQSIDLARAQLKFVSLNYLNCPGFTDSPEEFNALTSFLSEHPVDLIQWRNLNFDPIRYRKVMAKAAVQGPPIGIKNLLQKLRTHFPAIQFGYFNPPKEKFFRKGSNSHAIH